MSSLKYPNPLRNSVIASVDFPRATCTGNQDGFAILAESCGMHAIVASPLHYFYQQNRDMRCEAINTLPGSDSMIKRSTTTAWCAQRAHTVFETQIDLVKRFEIDGFASRELIKCPSLLERPFYSVLLIKVDGLEIEVDVTD